MKVVVSGGGGCRVRGVRECEGDETRRDQSFEGTFVHGHGY